jgi:hypothetical protein
MGIVVYCHMNRWCDLAIAFFFLSLLVALFPVLAIRDGLVLQSLLGTLAAATLSAAGVAAQAADVQSATQVTRRLGLAAAIPAIGMIIQLLPMPIPEFSHTIWINGNEALHKRAWGHISVDLGDTVQALAFYLANVALILATVLVARNHQRAGRLFTLLGAITILTVVALLGSRFFHVFAIAPDELRVVLCATSALGIVMSLAAGAAGLDRRESRRSVPDGNARAFLLASATGLVICVAGVVSTANANIAVVVAFGVATFASIQLVRRMRLATWATPTLLATLVTAALMIIVWRFDTTRAFSPLLQFATAASPSSLAVAQRLLSDTGWLGTGGGTYEVLLPIYRELGSMATQPPTTAAAFAVEFGMPMVLVAAAIGTGLIVMLYRGALSRGRDFFYAATAASGAVILLGQAFCDTSLLHPGVAVLGDALVGVGLAQSARRSDAA